MKKTWAGLAVILALAASAPARAETLTDDSVVAMVKAGLGAETIIAKIRATPNTFDLSTAQLIALKQAGVPDAVIAAMLNTSAPVGVASKAAVIDSTSPDPQAPHASGIYVLESDQTPPRMQMIDATISNQTKTTGILAYAFTYGLAPMQMKTVIPNASARVHTAPGRPIFYFYFDQANSSLSVGGWLPGAATSPSEFSLVRFDVTDGHREAVLGQVAVTGVKTGVMDKARVAFNYDAVAPGVFKVTPTADMSPGEYGFVYSIGSATGVGGTKIFDFAVAN
jgi:hypothetical protein